MCDALPGPPRTPHVAELIVSRRRCGQMCVGRASAVGPPNLFGMVSFNACERSWSAPALRVFGIRCSST